jgi:magnesium-transporting ATPase (P-type)
MTLTVILILLLQALIIALLIIWWVRWSPRGLAWAAFGLLAAVGLAALTSLLFYVPPYQVGCDGWCPGWRGYPLPTHRIDVEGGVQFDAPSFVRNAFFYYALFLAASAIVAWLARRFRWPERTWKARFIFVLAVVVLPLAVTPMLAPPPQPPVNAEAQRLSINAARNWGWQLHMRGFMDRRLALEDIRSMPGAEGPRVCFRIYTWFYLPYQRAFIDLDEAGVRALGGAEIPLTQSCYAPEVTPDTHSP